MSSTKKRSPLGTDVSTARREGRARRHYRLRKKVSGTPSRPRLVVNRSSRHIHAQIIDDLAGAPRPPRRRSRPMRAVEATRRPAARRSASLAERAKAAGIDAVVFDRGGNKYHGRIASLADAAREGGLEF